MRGAALLALVCFAGCEWPEAVPAPATLVYQLDVPRARRAWGTEASEPVELLAQAAEQVQRRFEIKRRNWWAEVEADPAALTLTVRVKDDIEERSRLLIDGVVRSLGSLEFLVLAEGEERSLAQRIVRARDRDGNEHALLLPDTFRESFGSGHFASVQSDLDGELNLLLTYRIFPARVDEFHDFTRRFAGRRVALCRAARILAIDTLEPVVDGHGQLRVRLDGLRELESLLFELERRSGPLVATH